MVFGVQLCLGVGLYRCLPLVVVELAPHSLHGVVARCCNSSARYTSSMAVDVADDVADVMSSMAADLLMLLMLLMR